MSSTSRRTTLMKISRDIAVLNIVSWFQCFEDIFMFDSIHSKKATINMAFALLSNWPNCINTTRYVHTWYKINTCTDAAINSLYAVATTIVNTPRHSNCALARHFVPWEFFCSPVHNRHAISTKVANKLLIITLKWPLTHSIAVNSHFDRVIWALVVDDQSERQLSGSDLNACLYYLRFGVIDIINSIATKSTSAQIDVERLRYSCYWMPAIECDYNCMCLLCHWIADSIEQSKPSHTITIEKCMGCWSLERRWMRMRYMCAVKKFIAFGTVHCSVFSILLPTSVSFCSFNCS